MIFDQLKIILVHIPRTAGTSIEAALSKLDPSPRGELAGTLPPNNLIRLAGQNKWDVYHKVAVVRNPFDRVVSTCLFGMMLGQFSKDDIINNNTTDLGLTPVQFSSYANRIYNHWETVKNLPDLQTNWLKAGGKFANDPYLLTAHKAGELVVDRVLRFESLEADFAKMLADLSLPSQPLPHLNRSLRRPYQSYYGNQERTWIEAAYGDDLTAFGYSY